jgi:hypothetical protein
MAQFSQIATKTTSGDPLKPKTTRFVVHFRRTKTKRRPGFACDNLAEAERFHFWSIQRPNINLGPARQFVQFAKKSEERQDFGQSDGRDLFVFRLAMIWL